LRPAALPLGAGCPSPRCYQRSAIAGRPARTDGGGRLDTVLLRALDQIAFRNLRTHRLEFSAGVTAVVGRNGAGKSNLLAAAYLGCNGNVASGTLGELVAHGQEEAYVAAEVEHDEGVSQV